jgi:hypothetical protein
LMTVMPRSNQIRGRRAAARGRVDRAVDARALGMPEHELERRAVKRVRILVGARRGGGVPPRRAPGRLAVTTHRVSNSP